MISSYPLILQLRRWPRTRSDISRRHGVGEHLLPVRRLREI